MGARRISWRDLRLHTQVDWISGIGGVVVVVGDRWSARGGGGDDGVAKTRSAERLRYFIGRAVSIAPSISPARTHTHTRAH